MEICYLFAIQDLKSEEHSKEAVECLNEMVTNALPHALDSLKYMSALQDEAVFRFCAIPQVRESCTSCTIRFWELVDFFVVSLPIY